MKPLALLTICTVALSSCTALISAPEPTNAWVPVGENDRGNIVSVDTGSYSKGETRALVWVRVDYTKPPKPQLNATQYYMSLDCDENRVSIQREVQLGMQGDVLEENIVSKKASNPDPGSTEGIVLDNVCFDSRS
jgi:hypothetical protein